MRASILFFTPALVALAAPGAVLYDVRNVDWEAELLGTKDTLDKRARNEASIDAIFKKLGKQYFGTAADRSLLNNAANSEIIKADFGQLTPENSYVITKSLPGTLTHVWNLVGNGKPSKPPKAISILLI